jgi:hypothetical protein
MICAPIEAILTGKSVAADRVVIATLDVLATEHPHAFLSREAVYRDVEIESPRGARVEFGKGTGETA